MWWSPPTPLTPVWWTVGMYPVITSNPLCWQNCPLRPSLETTRLLGAALCPWRSLWTLEWLQLNRTVSSGLPSHLTRPRVFTNWPPTSPLSKGTSTMLWSHPTPSSTSSRVMPPPSSSTSMSSVPTTTDIVQPTQSWSSRSATFRMPTMSTQWPLLTCWSIFIKRVLAPSSSKQCRPLPTWEWPLNWWSLPSLC